MEQVTGSELDKYKGDKGLVDRWLKEISIVEDSKQQQAYIKNGERILRKYSNAPALVADNARPWEAKVVFNILWSNVQVLAPMLYARTPKVVVERRFKDSDPIGRLASQIVERSTSFMLDTQKDRFNYVMSQCVQDRLLPGRGVCFLSYSAEFEDAVNEQGQPMVDESGQAIRRIKPNTEKVQVDPTNWQDYLESLSRNQYEVRWRAKAIYLSREDCITEFGEQIGKAIELNCNPQKSQQSNEQDKDFLDQAKVWVIYDLKSKLTLWISEGYKDGPCKVVKDQYRLDQFWPCPIPLVATTTSESTYPTPDYLIYERLAEELNVAIIRQAAMVDCVRLVGATSEQFNTDVKNMLSLNDGQLWPVKGWSQFVEKGGFAGIIDWLPFDNCVAAIPVLQQTIQEKLQQIFEITGIPDIARGFSDPNETLGAQKRKLRAMGTKAERAATDVQRFAREILAKMAEMIFEPGFFADETIALMCGRDQMPPDDQQNFPAALELLRNDRLRTFRVEIETDSTMANDEEEDKESRMEYINAMNALVGNIAQVSQFRPELMNPMIQSALFAARAFRTGKPLEGAWEKAMQEIEDNDEAAAQNPPPPDYEQMKVQTEQAKNQTEQMKVQIMGQELQMKQSAEQFKQQFEPWIRTQELEQKNQKMQMDFQLESQKIQIDGLKVQSEQQIAETEKELETFKAQFMSAMEQARLELEKYRVINSEGEKQLEEKRLAQEQQIELLRMAHEEKLADKQATAAPTKRGKRVHKVVRTPSGFVGESTDGE